MKAILPLIAIILGGLFPQLSAYSNAIQPLLMLLLFATFTHLNFAGLWRNLNLNVLLVPLANILLAFAWYVLIAPFDVGLARLYFITTIAPTAAAAPAMVNLLDRNVEYATVATVITNVLVALCVPFFSVWLFESDRAANALPILRSVVILMGVPLILAQLWQRLPHRWQSRFNWRQLSLFIWTTLLTLASAKASDFIRNESQMSLWAIAAIALHAGVVCATNFSLGRVLGRRRFAREASQSLGHKNTMFAVWFILSFLNPTFALGPMFYIVFQNVYNAYQIATIKPRSHPHDSGSGIR